jgi:P-type Ca2+ transporter type 2B
MHNARMNITQELLDSFNAPQAREENKAHLENIGGVLGLTSRLGVLIQTGFTNHQIDQSRQQFGENIFPESPITPFWDFVKEALSDTTLRILIAAATVSLAIGIAQDPKEGWVDGAAILFAVVVVTIVSSTNDYTKEQQFRALEQSSQLDERCSVFRNAEIQRINPKYLVVGDIVIFQVHMFVYYFLSLSYRCLRLVIVCPQIVS